MISAKREGTKNKRKASSGSLCRTACVAFAAFLIFAQTITKARSEPIPAKSDRSSITASPTTNTYYVSTSGSDTNNGLSRETAWRSIQHAADSAAPGDTILVLPGNYSGARIESSGTPGSVITLRSEKSGPVVLDSPGVKNQHQSILEFETWEGNGIVAYWNVEGFEVTGGQRYGIDIRNAHHINVRYNGVHQSGLSGIFTAFSDDIAIIHNLSAQNGEHGIYCSNSGDRPTVSHNILHHNVSCGLHMNGDLSMGGDGIIYDARIQANLIYENGTAGGSGINLDGVSNGLICNNLLYNNYASGISLFQIDGAVCSSDNKVMHNTVVMPSNGRWAFNMPDSGCTGNQLFNNIFYNAHPWRGSILLGETHPEGFMSDYNVLVNRLSTDAGANIIGFAAWQGLGYDSHSLISAPDQLFVDSASQDYHLRAASPAVNSGLLNTEVQRDLDENLRPVGVTVDVGVYEQSESKTYYVRPDGGTADQCSGSVDAPYPGSGSNQACAWSHPFWAAKDLYSNPRWQIAGGDTLFIHPGSYRMGFGAPNTETCDSAGAFACTLPPLPSGPDSQHPTRILGLDWDLGCSYPSELWGAERAYQIMDLSSTINARLACLEITDHAGCVEFHSTPAVRCERDHPPFGEWAGTGIYAADSGNVVLQDLNIHGLASAGIRAGRLSNWTLENVRIAGNGWVGWDGDIYGGDSNSGALRFRRWLVEWNGCVEKYPDGAPDHCWDQSAGGYGDGVGTGVSGGHWLIEDSIFRYNTSDGLDLLYIGRDSEESTIKIKRTQAYGNAGNQIKANGPTSIENCLIVGNCAYFQGKSFAQEMSDHCRAAGAALALNVGRGDEASVVNSTIAGQGDCLATFECDDQYAACDGTENLVVQNNIFRGYRDYFDSQDLSCYFWFDRDNLYTLSMDYNIIFNAKISSTDLVGPNDAIADPMILNDSLDAFDAHLQSPASPAVDTGLAVGSTAGLIPDHDLENILRPQLFGVDRGACEYRADPESGSLSVKIEPQAAILSGAKWRVDESNWKSSGETVSGLSIGDHTVTFMSISGWIAPSDQSVTIAPDQTKFLEICYQQNFAGSILWQRQMDGLVSLWSMNETDSYDSEKLYGPFNGWEARSYHKCSDGTARVLWQRELDGLVSLWTMDSAMNFTGEKLYGPFPGWKAKDYHRNLDGTGRILWQRTFDGLVSLWTVDASDSFTGEKLYGPFDGWEVKSCHRNSDGSGRILWQRAGDGLVSLWTVDGSDSFIGERLYGPFSGWAARSYDQNSAAAGRLLWQRESDGLVSLWTVDGSDNFAGEKLYGPFTDWMSCSYD